MAEVEKKFRDTSTGQIVSGKVDDSLSPADQYAAVMAQQQHPKNTIGQAVTDIGISGGVSAALAAISPELVSGAGASLMTIPTPWTEAAGAGLFVVGTGMKAGRLLLAADGLISGILSETAGQVVDQKTDNKVAQIGTRVAVSALTPSTALLKSAVGGSAKVVWNVYHAVVGEAAEKQTAVTAAEAVLKKATAKTPQIDLHEVLEKISQEEQSGAVKKAYEIINNAKATGTKVFAANPAAAQKIVEEGEKQAKALQEAAKARARVLTLATKGKNVTAARLNALADNARTKVIGEARDLTPIGEDLRAGIQETHKIEYETRAANDKVLRGARDTVVKQKVASGQEITQVPAYKQLVNQLAADAHLTEEGVKASKGRVNVTDPGTIRAYKQLHEALVPPGGGTPTMEAIDTARRRLAEVGHGAQGAEGYAALGQKFATDMSRRLGQIQEDYVGEAQKALQATYREGSDSIRDVSGKLARKSTAVDKINPDEFTMDAKDLPGMYFRSATKVEHLKNLIGEGPTKKLAGEYTSRLLAGHDSAYVEKFLRSKDSEWVKQVPGLPKKLETYAKQLKAYETNAKRLEQAAVADEKGAAAVKVTGQEAAEAARKLAKEKAKEVTKTSLQKTGKNLRKGLTTTVTPTITGAQRKLRNELRD